MNSPKLKILFGLLVPATVTTRASAQLKWEQREIELRPSLPDTAAVAHFKYENSGNKPIKSCYYR